MTKPVGFRSRGKGKKRKVYPVMPSGHKSKKTAYSRSPASTRRLAKVASLERQKEENLRISRQINAIVSSPTYGTFVGRLGKAIDDPKVRLVIGKGLQDGMKTDDIVKVKTSVSKVEDLGKVLQLH